MAWFLIRRGYLVANLKFRKIAETLSKIWSKALKKEGDQQRWKVHEIHSKN